MSTGLSKRIAMGFVKDLGDSLIPEITWWAQFLFSNKINIMDCDENKCY